jgi:Phytanoyl-CoA dioxygenase (PhyH)
MEPRAGPLSPGQVTGYEREGYLVVDALGLDPSVFEGAILDLKGRYEPAGVEREEAGVAYTTHRIMDAWKVSENVRAIALSPVVLSILERLYGRKPRPFQTLNFPYGTQQAPHSDSIHFNSIPPGFMVGVWVALEDIDMDCGPLVYYPGSHTLPEITMNDVGAHADPDEYPEYERFIAEWIERHGLEPHYATLRKGQALIWSANLLHGGAPQKDRTRSRHSQVTHVFFEGCKYYTPLLSADEEHISWRDPTWIA